MLKLHAWQPFHESKTENPVRYLCVWYHWKADPEPWTHISFCNGLKFHSQLSKYRILTLTNARQDRACANLYLLLIVYEPPVQWRKACLEQQLRWWTGMSHLWHSESGHSNERSHLYSIGDHYLFKIEKICNQQSWNSAQKLLLGRQGVFCFYNSFTCPSFLLIFKAHKFWC